MDSTLSGRSILWKADIRRRKSHTHPLCFVPPKPPSLLRRILFSCTDVANFLQCSRGLASQVGVTALHGGLAVAAGRAGPESLRRRDGRESVTSGRRKNAPSVRYGTRCWTRLARHRDTREHVFEVSRPVDVHPKLEYLAAFMLIATVPVPVWLAGGSRHRL
jgi:hypothetical protein